MTLIGPDGRKEAPNSYGDGQAVTLRSFSEAMAHDLRIYSAVIDLGRKLALLQTEKVN
jgi:hypothetical protein